MIDLTAREAQARFDALRTAMGEHHYLTIHLDASAYRPESSAGGCLAATAARSPGYRTVFTVRADTWASLVEEAEAKWLMVRDQDTADRVGEMAMKIIILSVTGGACADHDLRAAGFSAIEIETLGQRAVDEANRLSTKGPFTLVVKTGCNEPAGGVPDEAAA